MASGGRWYPPEQARHLLPPPPPPARVGFFDSTGGAVAVGCGLVLLVLLTLSALGWWVILGGAPGS